MSDNKNVPDIRFEGFSDEWEKYCLGSIAESFEYGLNAAAIEYDGINKYIRITDIDDETREFNIGRLTSPDTDLSVAENYKLKKSDLLFARTGASVGKTYHYKESDGLVYYAGFLIRARIKAGFSSRFVFQKTLTHSFYHFIKLMSQRSGQPGINAKEYSLFKIMTPKYPEQSQIGSYFQNLDKLITQHQNKHNQLVNLKKAMLEKMFPREGCDAPDIRFEGFSGVWNVKKLEEIAPDISDGNWIEAEHISGSGKYRIIQTGNLGLGEYLDKTNNAKYFEQANFNMVRGNEVFQGDILISRLAEPAGRTIILPDIGSKMVTVVDVTIVRPSNSFDSTFLMTLLNSEIVLSVVNSNVSGTSHKRISRRNLEKTKLTVPSIEEQQKIGAYFKNLDKLISLQKQQLEKLKNLKKACLDKMFV